MKKLIYWIVSLLEVVLLIAAYLINYFTPKKMGMFRFVGYKNMMWEERYNLQLLKSIALIIVVILAVLTIAMYFVKGRNIKTMPILATIVLTGLYVGFTMFNNVDIYKAFYFISPLLGIAALLQILKTLINILFTK